VLAPAASGAVALNAKTESTGVNDPAVLLTWIAKLADPSAEKTALLQVTSRKPVPIPVITITGGTGQQPWGCAPRGLALQRSPFALKALRLERTCASVCCGLGPEPLAQGQSRHLTPTEA
jgi:hypothetical protein